MDEAQWNDGLAASFFPPEAANRKVYLCLDDETIAEIAETYGWHLDNAVHDFESAIQSIARKVGDPFSGWRARLVQWRRNGRTGAPPIIALLGATVLAATRMVSGPAGGKANYYRQLGPILGLPPGWNHEYYRSFVPGLWIELAAWLQDVAGGARGLPSAWAPKTHDTKIGFSVSQALLRGDERERLAWFFVEGGLEPGATFEPAELLARFEEWTRASRNASSRFAELLRDSNLREEIAEIIAAELKDWDGTVRTREGYRVLQLVLTLNLRGGPLGLALRVPRDASPKDVVVAGKQVAVPEGSSFVHLPLKVSGEILEDGLRISDNKLRFVYRARPAVPFSTNDELGCWSSVERTALGAQHCALLNDSIVNDAKQMLDRAGSAIRPTRKVQLPIGWTVYKDIQITAPAIHVLPALKPLIPGASELPRLTGGLRVVPRLGLYLQGGAPDVIVPGLASHSLRVIFDGAEIAVVDEEGRVIELESLRPAPGDHWLSIGSTSLSFTIARQQAEPRPQPLLLGHHLAFSTSGFLAMGLSEPVDSPRGSRGDLVVSGAALDIFGTGEKVRYPIPPVMIKTGAQGYVAFGQPGEFADLTVSQPLWAQEIGLSFNSFEVEDHETHHGFGFYFVARCFATKTSVTLVRQPTDALVPETTTDALVQWAKCVDDVAQRPLDFNSSEAQTSWLCYWLSAEEVLQRA